MLRVHVVLAVALLVVASTPSAVHAQQATPVSDVSLITTPSPLVLYESLLAATPPENLLPDGVAPLSIYPWQDSNDPDLDGSIGGVIYTDIDPFGAGLPSAITYLIYPNADGPLEPLATVQKYGEAAELQFEERLLPAGYADLGGLKAHFVAIDNVLVYGMAPDNANDAETTASALTVAGLAHLLDITEGVAPAATPVSSAMAAAEQALLAVAAADYPTERIPFDTGPLVILPAPITADERAESLLGSLVVRDADRRYPYPLATYRFYADRATRNDAAAAAVRGAGTPTPVPLPPEIQIPYPIDIIHRNDDSTRVLVRVGPTIITVDTYRGDQEERRATALTLAQIAVDHLEAVTGQDRAPATSD